jgi:DNA polymerase-3 subunit alpha
VLESIMAAGGFDTIEGNRAQVFAAIDSIMATAQRSHENLASGALEFSFGETPGIAALNVPTVEPWLPADRLQREFNAVGFFLSGHPLDDYMAALKRMRVQPWAEFSRAVKSGASAGRVAGTVVTRQERRTRNGNKMGIIELSDPSGHYEAVLFSEALQQFRDLLEPGTAVLLTLSAELEGEEVRARIQAVEPLDQATSKMQKSLRVFLRSAAPLESFAKRLEGTQAAPPLVPGRPAQDNKSEGEISVVLMLDQGAEVEVKLPGRFKISPQIAGAIKAVPGVVDVQAL